MSVSTLELRGVGRMGETHIRQISISLYAPRSSKMILPPPTSSAKPVTVNRRGPDMASVSRTLTWSTKQDDLTRRSVRNHCCLERQSNADSSRCDEVMSTRMTKACKCVHLGVDAHYAPAGPHFKFGAPCRWQTEVACCYRKALGNHERGEEVVRISSTNRQLHETEKINLVAYFSLNITSG